MFERNYALIPERVSLASGQEETAITLARGNASVLVLEFVSCIQCY